MTEAIIVALIMGVLSCIGNWITAKASKEKMINEQKAELEKMQIRTDEKLAEIYRRLTEHNGYAEKFAQSSAEISAIQKDIAVIKTTLEFVKDAR